MTKNRFESLKRRMLLGSSQMQGRHHRPRGCINTVQKNIGKVNDRAEFYATLEMEGCKDYLTRKNVAVNELVLGATNAGPSFRAEKGSFTLLHAGEEKGTLARRGIV